ncbi:MAG: hypothetical protein IJM27_02580 [Eubacterium sp.]|nr:hypothetical protein [Eubacterium sp.]
MMVKSEKKDIKEERIRKLLLMPIVCDKKIDHVYRVDNTIYSGQQYYSNADDPDMSDIAIWFYEKIYSIDQILKKEDNGKYYFKTPCFAGDTMNSYRTVSKGADEDNKEKWFTEYHCLANFWLLPKDIGRFSPHWSDKRCAGIAKKGKNEFLDVFLGNYYNRRKDYEQAGLKEYIDKFSSKEDDFKRNHYLPEDVDFSGDSNNKINKMREFIKERARIIAEQMCEILYDSILTEFPRIRIGKIQ